jgi:hypothetical protein
MEFGIPCSENAGWSLLPDRPDRERRNDVPFLSDLINPGQPMNWFIGKYFLSQDFKPPGTERLNCK